MNLTQNAFGKVFCAAAFFVARAMAIDMDLNNVNDLWEGQYPTAQPLVDGHDSDGDGQSDASEAIARTDPFDATNVLRLTFGTRQHQGVDLMCTSMPGVGYQLERWSAEHGAWQDDGDIVIGGAWASQVVVTRALLPTQPAIYRFRTVIVDVDGDGLDAWEEQLLGLSDANAASNGTTGSNDYAAAFASLEGAGTVALSNGVEVPRRLPSHDAALRLLQQTTFGPTNAELDTVKQIGVTGWIEQQLAHATKSTTTANRVGASNFTTTPSGWSMGWLRTAVIAPDQLRQRMAYALSQIFVNSNQSNDIMRSNVLLQQDYYDIFINRAFGRYRDLLEEVTYSAQMGLYLSHLRNRKSDPATGRFPDENFAREIMQLFSIGLNELELDGTLRRDAEGNLIPTYDNTTIREMAKIFTGFSFGGPRSLTFESGVPFNDAVHPMKVFESEHEPGIKNIVGGVTVPAGLTPDEDVALTLDTLAAHDNTAPFISRILIQRLTSSNPSPNYIRRVSRAWRDTSLPSDGNFSEVVRAILLDPEAREQRESGGRVQEPIMRWVYYMRSFNLEPEGNTASRSHPADPNGARETFGQFPMWAPSVFNFYSPDFAPPGELRDNSLVSPELELATASQMIATDNYFRNALYRWIEPFGGRAEDRMTPDLDDLIAVAGNGDDLIEALRQKMVAGPLSATTKQVLRDFFATTFDPVFRTKTAVWLMLESPEFVVLR